MNGKPDFSFEIDFCRKYQVVAGVDEVGRGALAGPIIAAAVVFDDYEKVLPYILGIDDSKKLSATKRLKFDGIIKKVAVDYKIGIVTSDEIDRFGVGVANIVAFERALKQLKQCDFVLIDGRPFKGLDYKYLCLEKGESKSVSIAAASIIAKVYRDALMQEMHDEIFRYDFASNKGYGSKQHLKALNKYGPSSYHRKTFLGKIFNTVNQKSLFNF